MQVEFKHNDKAYLLWLGENPNGFVVNTRRVYDPSYMVLHRATCRTVCTYPDMEDKVGGFTEKTYVKICASTIDELRTWIKTQGRPDGSFSKECGICTPV